MRFSDTPRQLSSRIIISSSCEVRNRFETHDPRTATLKTSSNGEAAPVADPPTDHDDAAQLLAEAQIPPTEPTHKRSDTIAPWDIYKLAQRLQKVVDSAGGANTTKPAHLLLVLDEVEDRELVQVVEFLCSGWGSKCGYLFRVVWIYPNQADSWAHSQGGSRLLASAVRFL